MHNQKPAKDTNNRSMSQTSKKYGHGQYKNQANFFKKQGNPNNTQTYQTDDIMNTSGRSGSSVDNIKYLYSTREDKDNINNIRKKSMKNKE